MLKTNTSIQSLQLLNLRLKGETIDFIGKGMKYNTSILSLDLQGSLMVSLQYISLFHKYIIYIYIYIMELEIDLANIYANRNGEI